MPKKNVFSFSVEAEVMDAGEEARLLELLDRLLEQVVRSELGMDRGGTESDHPTNPAHAHDQILGQLPMQA